jgi:hypothetical protein
VNIPLELEKQFVVIEHERPGREQLAEIARSVATEPGDFPEDPVEQESLLEAASGLTRFEAESVCSLSLTRHSRLVPHLADAKARLHALADFADDHGDRFLRIQFVAKSDDGTLWSLDLLDADVRAAVRRFEGGKVSALYRSEHAMPYK